MTGPCMCGDPYCGSCGDPSLADWEAAIDGLVDVLDTHKVTGDELALFVNVGLSAVMNARELADRHCADVRQGDMEHIDWLKSRIQQLEGDLPDPGDFHG